MVLITVFLVKGQNPFRVPIHTTVKLAEIHSNIFESSFEIPAGVWYGLKVGIPAATTNYGSVQVRILLESSGTNVLRFDGTLSELSATSDLGQQGLRGLFVGRALLTPEPHRIRIKVNGGFDGMSLWMSHMHPYGWDLKKSIFKSSTNEMR